MNIDIETSLSNSLSNKKFLESRFVVNISLRHLGLASYSIVCCSAVAKKVCRTSLQSDQNLRGPHVARRQQLLSISAARARPQQQTRRCCSTRQTDVRTLDRFMTFLYANRVIMSHPCRRQLERLLLLIF